MNDRACRTANALTEMGVAIGDRVAILAQNCPEYYDTYFGVAKIGAITVPLNWRLAPPEIQFILENSGARTLIFGPEYIELVAALRGRIPAKDYIYAGTGDVPDFARSMKQMREEADSREPDWKAEGEDTLVIMYTSGTTGKPKGSMLTHANFFWASVTFHVLIQGSESPDMSLVVLPLFHIAGMFAMPTAVHWGDTVFLIKGFAPQLILETIQKQRITIFGAVPAILGFMRMVPNWQSYDFSSVKTILVFAAPVPVPLIQEYATAGVIVRQLYGLTECTGPATVIGPEDAVSRAGSCGKAFFHTEVKVVDDSGEETKPREMGEVIMRGGHIMKGYWQNAEATAETLRDGWLHTGDIAYRDEDGFLYIADRKKDMIISGGENIYPAEIESVIFGHPKVADVAIIGMPDKEWGESAKAVVVPKKDFQVTPEEIIEYCRGKIAKYKIPKAVVFTDALPRNAAGKVLKRILREKFN
jgi:acyl-CoA synthetase (AMP-forming)/AMP-acid ligase II